MGRIATAVHALKNKNLYLSIKEKIPGWLLKNKETLQYNPESVTIKIMPILGKAFDNGIEFQQARFSQKLGVALEWEEITKEGKYKIIKVALKLLILKMQTAADRYTAKITEIEKLNELKKIRVDPVKTIQGERAWGEYVNAVKGAVNACIIDTGRAAEVSVIKIKYWEAA